jgi:hypothetical protein
MPSAKLFPYSGSRTPTKAVERPTTACPRQSRRSVYASGRRCDDAQPGLVTLLSACPAITAFRALMLVLVSPASLGCSGTKGPELRPSRWRAGCRDRVASNTHQGPTPDESTLSNNTASNGHSSSCCLSSHDFGGGMAPIQPVVARGEMRRVPGRRYAHTNSMSKAMTGSLKQGKSVEQLPQSHRAPRRIEIV